MFWFGEFEILINGVVVGDLQKMVALKKAYAEIILNTAKEAAARIMVSERKALRFQQDLSASKEEALRMLLRLKHMIDSKVFLRFRHCFLLHDFVCLILFLSPFFPLVLIESVLRCLWSLVAFEEIGSSFRLYFYSFFFLNKVRKFEIDDQFVGIVTKHVRLKGS